MNYNNLPSYIKKTDYFVYGNMNNVIIKNQLKFHIRLMEVKHNPITQVHLQPLTQHLMKLIDLMVKVLVSLIEYRLLI